VLMKLRWALGGRIARATKQVGQLERRMERHHPEHTLAVAKHRLNSLERQLEAMSYQCVLARGYSVTRTADGTIVHAPADAPAGTQLSTELAGQQQIRSVVDGDSTDAPVFNQPKPPKPRKPRKKRTQTSKQSGESSPLFDMMND
ncbi:MAG: hypothetical protein HN909_08865, partial [Phycisphaerales bacterium]|nr:hypothetical protein [Phycisphaerales bacterium]